MGVSIPIILADEWYNFVENGLTKPTRLVKMGKPLYDGNKVIKQPGIIHGPFDAIWQDFKLTRNLASIAKADDSTVLSIDKMIVFPVLVLPVAPALTDEIVDDSHVEWSIIGIETDPAGAHYRFHIRPIRVPAPAFIGGCVDAVR